MKIIRSKLCALFLVVALTGVPLPARAANYEIPGSCLAQTQDGAGAAVKTLDYGYDSNTYVSLRDLAMVLKDTDKSFSLDVTKNAVSLNPGRAYRPTGGENVLWDSAESPNIALRRNEFSIGEQSVFYYTMIMALPSGGYDCFMAIADIAMILDVDLAVTDAGVMEIDTGEPFCADPADLERAGYFEAVNSVLIGDASTGEVYYQYQSDVPYPIASTTKLMTSLLVLEAVSAGQLALEDQVTVSAAAQALADSSDGVLPLTAGQQVSVRELLFGTLLPSSNESALALAEAVAGSEEAFVQMMNQKAQELGLSEAVFYNSNGLPVYTQTPIPSKRQNHMSAADMFRLASYLLKVYPQITDITSLKSASLESMSREVRNTNPLLHNLSGVTGLKTGTTNKAGACLVTSLTASAGAEEHDLVVVLLGAEDSIERGRVSGILAYYARQAFHAKAQGLGGGGQDAETPAPGQLPQNAEAAVTRIIRTARKR